MSYQDEILLELHNRFYPHKFSYKEEPGSFDIAYRLFIDDLETNIFINSNVVNDMVSCQSVDPEEELSILIQQEVSNFLNN